MSKVYCSNCGAEVILPEHSCVTSGVTISEKDTKGTYVIPTKENKKMSRAEERLEKLKAAGVDVSNFMVLTGSTGESFVFKNENGIPTPVLDDDPIYETIKTSGYVFNRFVDARWITAQMFQMLNYNNRWSGNKGYDGALADKGYEYQFKFLREELHRLAKMERDNDPQLEVRGQFFTKEVVREVLDDYLDKLRKYITHLPTYKCKGVPYKRIPGFKGGSDRNGDVFIADLEHEVYRPLRSSVINIMYSRYDSYTMLSRSFDYWMDEYYIPFKKYEFRQSKVFRDTYKGMGAYYTCDNLIKYHGCRVKGLSVESSLSILRDKTKAYKGEYWRLFAFMKELIEDNNFKPDWRR